MPKQKTNRNGQSLTEYVILVGTIAIGSMLLVSKFAEAIKTATGNMVNVLTNQKVDRRGVDPVRHEHMRKAPLWDAIKKRPFNR